MKLSDACLVVADARAVGDVLRDRLGLQHRMRNEHFVDFAFAHGARLAAWDADEVADTIGGDRLGLPCPPFSVTLSVGNGATADACTVEVGAAPDVRIPAAVDDDAAIVVGGVAEVVLHVTDLDRSAAFYDDLGFRRQHRSATTVAFEGAGSVLALVASASDPHAPEPAGSRPGLGNRLLCAIELDDREQVDELYDRLAGAGHDVCGPPQRWPWGAWAAYFTDPDGHLWELYAWVAEPYTW